MAKVLVLYYSSYGHIEQMANAEAEGARSAGAQVEIKRVPETVPEDVARKSGFKLDQPSKIELEGARYQGRHVAQIAEKIAAKSAAR